MPVKTMGAGYSGEAKVRATIPPSKVGVHSHQSEPVNWCGSPGSREVPTKFATAVRFDCAPLRTTRLAKKSFVLAAKETALLMARSKSRKKRPIGNTDFRQFICLRWEIKILLKGRSGAGELWWSLC